MGQPILVACPRHLWMKERKLPFLTELASAAPDADALHCGTIEMFVKDNARLRFVNLQDWGSSHVALRSPERTRG